jgi:hypothetical protein
MIETMSMNVTRDSQLLLRKYNTCILFTPSKITVEEGTQPYQINEYCHLLNHYYLVISPYYSCPHIHVSTHTSRT